ncbi:MAG TPA: cupin domain-containing protein [Methanomassiliicoccales archaeon]|nr:cupin domain-containing protein [Methanomassiliicoccales archaeon]
MTKEMLNPDGVGKEDLRGKVMVSKDLVSYQDGAVVSRTLVNKPVGTVTVFSFDEGQGLSEHTAPYDAIVEILDGEADITISGRAQRVRAGEMVIMPANHPHALHGVKRFKMMLTMIRA